MATFTLAAALACSGDDAITPPELPSESLEVTRVGSELWSEVSDMATSGSLVFCVMPYGLQVLDVSDPEHPIQAASVYLPCEANRVAAEGEYAYVLGGGRLRVIHVSASGSAQVVGSLEIEWGGGLAVRDGHVYIQGGGRLIVVDVQNPQVPTVVSEIPQGSREIAIEGEFLYLLNNSGLTIFGIDDPAHPLPLGGFEIDHPRKMTVTGNVCGVWSGNCATFNHCWGQINMIDVSDPESPTQVSTVPHHYHGEPEIAVASLDELLFVYGRHGRGTLKVLDISNPEQPVWMGEYGSNSANTTCVVTGGDSPFDRYVFLPEVQIVSVTNPSAPSLAGQFRMPSSLRDVVVEDSFAYAVNTSGLFIVDVTDPENPARRGHFPGGYVQDIAVDGGYAYLADRDLRIIDVTNPDRPALAGSFVTPEIVNAIALAGNRAYLAEGRSGLQIVDMNPFGPELIGSVTDLGNVIDVAVQGNHAYVTTEHSHLKVIDVSTPAQPALAGVLYIGGSVWEVAVRENLAIVANDYDGIHVVDVSNPEAPSLLATFDTPWKAYGVSLEGDHAYVTNPWYGCDEGGFSVINVSDPRRPFLDGHFDVPGRPQGLAVAEPYAYVADGNGLLVLHVGEQ